MALNSYGRNFRQHFIFAVTFFILIFLICPVSFGILPPKVYKEAIHSSAIKAIAVVEKVEVLNETNRSIFKKVLFKLEKSLTRGSSQKKVPQEFSGSCYSVDHKWQNPGVGGTIHYYPRIGARVLVTISSDGGGITSYTTLSPAFEEELKKNGLQNIEFGMGHATIKRSIVLTKKLFNALYDNNTPYAKYLLSKKVDVNSRNETGQTLLHIAQDKEIIKLLISKGADVNARDDQGMTPIFNKEVRLIQLLTQAGADISLKSSKGNTAVMWFAYSGYLDGIRYLVSRGADIKVKNKDNQTALDIAEKFGHLKVVEYLESARSKSG